MVGESGSGKSTLVRLLCRFYDPDGGSIFIGGQNILNVDLASLRKALAVIPQASCFFNLCFFQPPVGLGIWFNGAFRNQGKQVLLMEE